MEERQQMYSKFLDNLQDEEFRDIAEQCMEFIKSEKNIWEKYYDEYLKNRENIMMHKGKSTVFTLPCYNETEFEYDVLNRFYVEVLVSWNFPEEIIDFASALDSAAKSSRDMLTFLLMEDIPKIETSLEALEKVQVEQENCKRFLNAMIAIAKVRKW